MAGILKIGFLAVVAGACLVSGTSLAAQGFDGQPMVDEESDESTDYRQPAYRPDTREIIFQKAQTRAYQRQTRLASCSWYGISNSRPTASTTPFTSRYSPMWEMPGGRPFAWYPQSWPTYVIYTR